jgi:NhaP-type Na+/H+ or K+/H+ antiporter
MDKYLLLLTVIGFAAFGMAWMPAISKYIRVSYSIIYVAIGAILYLLFPNALPDPNPIHSQYTTLHLSEIVVIISLMGTGIKIDQVFSVKKWKAPLRLISIAMILCIAATAVLGIYYLHIGVASALLLGAVLAPTDPVLASDVQVGPPNDGKISETKFTLTAEGGLNDGMAFPFIWLAVLLATTGLDGEALVHWLVWDVAYKIIAGIIIGLIMGKIAGYIVFEVSKKYHFLETRDGFLAIALTFIVYGITELASGYGFIAVFISAITLRHYEKHHDYHNDLHDFTDQAERLLIAILLIFFGGALVKGILAPLTVSMALFSVLFLFVVRPLAAYLSLLGVDLHQKKKIVASFFGIRGMGSIFYLAFAFSQAPFIHKEEIWATVAFTILISIFIHGLTANPVMQYLRKRFVEPDKRM